MVRLNKVRSSLARSKKMLSNVDKITDCSGKLPGYHLAVEAAVEAVLEVREIPIRTPLYMSSYVSNVLSKEGVLTQKELDGYHSLVKHKLHGRLLTAKEVNLICTVAPILVDRLCKLATRELERKVPTVI